MSPSPKPSPIVEFTLAGKVVDELVDWHNWRGRAAVVEGRTRRNGAGTLTVVRMRSDDARDLLRYLCDLDQAVAALDVDQRRGVDMMPVRRTIWRLRHKILKGSG